MSDRSSAGEARRTAVAAAQNLGFSPDRQNDIGIAATEVANNILLHAGSGEFVVCPFQQGSAAWLDLLALDAGKGIEDVSRAFEDGYSTAGTAGQGLGAVKRLSDSCTVYSVAQKGTAFLSRFQRDDAAPKRSYGAVSLAMKGETVCGDAFLVLPGATRSLYMVVDGLGHGAHANEAAEVAVATVGACLTETAIEIVSRTHDALKKTRGAAMSVAIVDHDKKVVTYAGIGNISGMLTTGSTSRNMISQNGTLGAILPRVQEFVYPYQERTSLIMFSDGLNSKCNLTAHPGLAGRWPELIAGVLYRDFSRHRDDATVLVASLSEDAL